MKGMKLPLIFYDLIAFFVVDIVLLVFYKGAGALTTEGIVYQSLLAVILIFGSRCIGKIYRQIWRYGGIQCYIRLLGYDALGFICYFIAERVLGGEHIAFVRLLALCCMNTLGALTIRMVYRFAYKCGSQDNKMGEFLRMLLKVFAMGRVSTEPDPDSQKIKVAIIGAGSVGVNLAEDLLNNQKSNYVPRCFIDNDPAKVGCNIHSISVMSENEATLEKLKSHNIQEVIFAVPNMASDRKENLYDYYQKAGFRIKVYDYPNMDSPSKKRQLRELSIEDLLMREQKELIDDKTRAYYKGKTVLITGGGGSIGSELGRQLAKMKVGRLIVLDVYENCAYDLQQELKINFPEILVNVEIVSITNKRGLSRVFNEYKPEICINAAAHKHVPLMEKNCIEAVENNVFGTLNVIQCCEEYACKRFMMVSTDKAVKPTNVMGATKIFCEMIMQTYSTRGNVKCSATRFGNVLGSAGSVIPLFKRQIASGGPITLTDKRIIRYFMTIPEASQLVLTSGAMAQSGDLFVLDMGKPVKIYDLANNMIQFRGIEGIEIVETGLRPGEKLYEELLVKNDNLQKTENDLIFIEHEESVSMGELSKKLKMIKDACEADLDDLVRETMRIVVPTFKRPEEVNGEVEFKFEKNGAILREGAAV